MSNIISAITKEQNEKNLLNFINRFLPIMKRDIISFKWCIINILKAHYSDYVNELCLKPDKIELIPREATESINAGTLIKFDLIIFLKDYDNNISKFSRLSDLAEFKLESFLGTIIKLRIFLRPSEEIDEIIIEERKVKVVIF